MLKRTLGTIAFFLCMVLFLPIAHAEEIKVNVTATPTELSQTGTVAFSFEISNYSDYVISEINISYLGNLNAVPLAEPVPPNGSIRDLVLNLSVAESQLGSPIVFTVTCVRNGEPLTQDVSIIINRAADPMISLTRDVSAQMIRQGETATLTYTLKNETKFDMTDITLIDQEISDTPIVNHQDVLYAGAEVSIKRPFTMETDDAVSAPVVTYTVNGKTKTFSGVEPVTLTMLLIKLDLKIDAGVPTANGVTFTIDVQNTGNQEISNITITDERKNAVNSTPFSLKAGEKATHSFQVIPVMSETLRNVKFYLSGLDPTGAAYNLESEKTYEVYPYVDASQISVTVAAETVTPWTADAGKLTARIKIINHSQVALTNVTVSETNLGVIQNIEKLSTGETQFDYEVSLGSPRNLSFTVKGNDPTGASRELAVCALPVAYGTEAAPEATIAPIQPSQGNSFSFLSTTISKILLILGVLMVVAFITLVALSVLERSRTGGIRFDDESDDDELDDYFDENLYTEEQAKAEEEAYFTRRNTIRTQQDPNFAATKRHTTAGRIHTEGAGFTQRSTSPYGEPSSTSYRRDGGAISLPPAAQEVPVEYDTAPAFIEFDTDPLPEYDSRKAVYHPSVRENTAPTGRYGVSETTDQRQSTVTVRSEEPVNRSCGPKVYTHQPLAGVRPAIRNEVRHVKTKGDTQE